MTKLFFIFADILPEATWNEIGASGKGILIWMSVGLVAMGFIHLFKKTFGPKPPMDEQLKQIVKLLRAEIHREKNSVLKEVRLTMKPIIEQVGESKSKIEDIEIDRVRKWETLTTKMNEVATSVAFMRGEKKGEQSR